MTIEKVPPLSSVQTDLHAGRASGPARAAIATTFTPAAIAPTTLDAGAHANFFDSISLPLPDATTPTAGEPGRSPASPYARAAATLDLPQLIAGRLPPQLLAGKADTLLRQTAADRDTTVAQVIDETGVTKDALLPSRNGAEARFTLRTSFLAQDENGETQTLDLYLTRTGARQWEAAVFERNDPVAQTGFPHPAPPIALERLVIDPSTGHILASVAQQIAPRSFASGPDAETRAFVAAVRVILFAIALVAATYLLARAFSSLVALGFCVTAIALAIRIPGASGKRRAGFTRSRRRQR